MTGLSETKPKAYECLLCVLLTVVSVCLFGVWLAQTCQQKYTQTFHCMNSTLGLIIYLILSYTLFIVWTEFRPVSITHTDCLSPDTHSHLSHCDILTYKHTLDCELINLDFFGGVSFKKHERNAFLFSRNLSNKNGFTNSFFLCFMNKHILNYWWTKIFFNIINAKTEMKPKAKKS